MNWLVLLFVLGMLVSPSYAAADAQRRLQTATEDATRKSLGCPSLSSSSFDFQHWGTAKTPAFCVVVRTIKKHGPQLLALLMSLVVKRPPRLNVFVTNTADEPFDEMKSTIRLVNDLMNSTIVHDTSDVMNISYARKYFNDPLVFDFAGYVLTDLVIEHIIRLQDNELKPLCNYILVTNGDNLYNHELFMAIAEKASRGRNLIGVHFTSHYRWAGPNSKGVCMTGRKGHDAEVIPAFKVDCVDLGAVAFTPALMGADRFVITQLDKAKSDPDRVNRADGLFFARLARKTDARHAIIRRVMMMHQ